MVVEDFLAVLHGFTAANCRNFGLKAVRKLDLTISVSMEAEFRSHLEPAQMSRRRVVHR